eukprot:GHVL01044016.1.p1 GENE.GHVL01044016.1~~GHVL01044016.1.p1  ORF type:complete len:363 (-),score=35.87 GHVL01044016.1:979-2067(-)
MSKNFKDLAALSPKIKKILDFCNLNEVPNYQFKLLLSHIYGKNKRSAFSNMIHLPLGLRSLLQQEFGADNFLSLKMCSVSQCENVQKNTFECENSAQIESVHVKLREHSTLYISSQVGCAFKCSFCATGKLGLKRQLTCDEITDQVLYSLQNNISLTSVSFSGMGEPLANPNIFDAITVLTEPNLFGISPRRLTVCTVGILAGIVKLNELHPRVNLCFSLGSPFNEERSKMMFVNRLYSIQEVFRELDRRVAFSGKNTWISYTLLKNRNDSQEHAEALASLIKKRPKKHLFHVALGPYNEVENSEELAAVDKNTYVMFMQVLKNHGISVSKSNSFGGSINAAMGQLTAGYLKPIETANSNIL